jgi:hypothetical protein
MIELEKKADAILQERMELDDEHYEKQRELWREMAEEDKRERC